MPLWLTSAFDMLALPQYGLSTLFVAAFVSATLIPVGSEPALFGLLQLNPDLFWPAVLVATAGNTLGGAVDWWMGYEAHHLVDKYRHSRTHIKAIDWLERLGPKACLLAWLPLIGDPLCAVAGWLRMPFWPCLGYMLIGKLLRYVIMTSVLLHMFPAGNFVR
ncbi:DedA family protein [Ramlibacter sp. RBP-2]|uniref:DedA family protein n=1 Tax=Ramlibacter lithotrophicus TaxID=2606681 RepID=A0A7X6DID2_9BURK|nr:YqaA family protein [Ramlibacter lithotrophicus]NKE67717.1 DedA family protein [Ramlibacter lithotrophicus]